MSELRGWSMEPGLTKPCDCGKKMILVHTGEIHLTDPAQFPQEWWCGGCGKTEPGPTCRGKTDDELRMEQWRAANPE